MTRARSDAGLSLVEVLVGMVIFTALMGLVTGLVVDLLRTGTGTTNRLSNVDELRVSMDGVTKALRTAVRPEQVNPACTAPACASAFLAADADKVTFYANYGPGKVRLTTYSATPDASGLLQLVERSRVVALPALTDLPCGAECAPRTLATGLAAAAVFSYATSDCATFSPSVAAFDRPDIACVLIDVPIRGARDNPGTSARSTVFLPNSAMGR